MALIEKKDIYSGGDPFEEIRKGLVLLDDAQKKLIADNKILIDNYIKIKASYDANEAKQRINDAKLLAINNKSLAEIEQVRAKVQIELVRAETLRNKQSQEAEKVNTELIKQNNQLLKNENERIKNEQQLVKLAADKAKFDKMQAAETEKLAKAAKKQAEETEKLNVSINTQTKSIKDLQKVNAALNEQRRNLDLTTKEGKKQYDLLTSAIRKNEDQLKSYDNEIGRSQRNVGNYWGSFKQGIATLGGYAAAAYGVIQSLRGLYNIIEENNKIHQRLNQTLKPTNDELTTQITLVKQIASGYGKDYNEIIESANALTKQLGIDGTDALSLIKTGFEKGADSTGQFMQMLREYPTFMKEAGLTAKQTIALMAQAAQMGVYDDKAIDTIKEATIRLRELTPATRAALDGIGLSSKELETQLKKGSITYFDAIQLVSNKLKTLPPQSKEVGTALADIFGGAGEDAGLQYITTIGEINTNLDELATNATESAKATNSLNDAWATFTTKMAEGEGVFGKMFTGLKKLGAQILNDFVEINDFGLDAVYEFGKRVSTVGGGINDLTKSLGSELTSLQSEMIRAQRKGDDELKKELSETYTNVESQVKILYGRIQAEGITLTEQQISFFRRFGLERVEIEQDIATETNKIKAESFNAAAIEAEKQRIAEIEAEKVILERLKNNVAQVETQNQSIIDSNRDVNEQEILNQQLKSEALNDYNNALLESQRLREEIARQEQEVMIDSLTEIGKAFGMMLATGEMSLKDFLKLTLVATLDAVQKTILIYTAQILAREVASKSFAGIATAALLNGLVIGGFEAVKSKVGKFAEGGEVGGRKHSEGGTLIEAERGEFVIKSDRYAQSKRLVQGINQGRINDTTLPMQMIENKDNVYLSEIAKNTGQSGISFVKDGFIHIYFANGSTKKIRLD